MADAIDKWVVQENPNTTFKGLGATIVASAKNSNINPFLLVAIPRIESSMGDPGDFNVKNANNAYGREASSDQPHINGSHPWYRWSSVKASVDYTATENKGIKGGGDMASYIRDQYGSSIASNDFVSLITAYAPPAENDTAAYIANVKSWISQLASLAQGGSGTSTPTDPSSTCISDSSTGSGSVTDMVNLAMSYAWADGPHGATQKDSYAKAVIAAIAKGWYVGGGSPAGDDCGGFVTTVMRTSGADPNYNSANGNTVAQQAYLEAGVKSGKYQSLGQPSDTHTLQAGDIAVNSGHTFIYVGPVSQHPDFHGDQASASVPDRAPSAEILGVYPDHADGPFTFYRLIKPGG
jgi:hypothetical protein